MTSIVDRPRGTEVSKSNVLIIPGELYNHIVPIKNIDCFSYIKKAGYIKLLVTLKTGRIIEHETKEEIATALTIQYTEWYNQ